MVSVEQVAVANPVAPIARTGIASETATASRWRYRARTLAAHVGAMLLFALLTALMAPRIVLHPSRLVTPDLIDPVYYLWSLSSSIHNLTTWPDGLWSLFDGNIYYPVAHAASYTDVTVGLLPLSLILHAVIHNPVVLLNILAGLSFVLSAYGAFVLGRLLTHNYAAGVVAGLVFGFSPFRAEHLGHVNVLSTEYMVATAVCLVVAWRRERLRWWIGAGVLAGLSAVTELYYLAYLALPILGTAPLLGRAWTQRRVGGALIATTTAALFVLPFTVPYLIRHADIGAAYGEARSIDVLSFLRVTSGRPLDGLLLPRVPIQMMQPNHAYFPGFIVLALALLAWRGRRGRPWGLFALACAVLVLGPSLQVGVHALPIPLPYALLERLVPHFQLFRDPTRAMVGVSLGLAVLAAWGLHELLQQVKAGLYRRMVAAAAIVLVALEVWTPAPVVSIAAIPAGEHWFVSQQHIHVVLELPISHATPLDWQWQSEIMYDSTVHWKRIVNGASSLDPVGVATRRAMLATYPSTDAMLLLRQLRVDAVVLRLAWLTPAQRRQAQAACHVAYRDSVEVICLGPWAPVRTARAGR